MTAESDSFSGHHKVNATLHNIQNTGLAPQHIKGSRCHAGHTGVTLGPEMKIGSTLSGTPLTMHSASRPHCSPHCPTSTPLLDPSDSGLGQITFLH